MSDSFRGAQLGLNANHKDHPLRPYAWNGSDLAEYDDTSGTTVVNGRLTFQAMPADRSGISLDVVPKEGGIRSLQIRNKTTGSLRDLEFGVDYDYVSADGKQLARIDIKDGKAPNDSDVVYLAC